MTIILSVIIYTLKIYWLLKAITPDMNLPHML